MCHCVLSASAAGAPRCWRVPGAARRAGPSGAPAARAETIRVQVRRRTAAHRSRRCRSSSMSRPRLISEFAPAAGDDRTRWSGCSKCRRSSRAPTRSPHRGRHARDGFDLCSTDALPALRAGAAWPRRAGRRRRRDAVAADAGRGALVRRRAGARRVPRRLRRPHERRGGCLGRHRPPYLVGAAGRRAGGRRARDVDATRPRRAALRPRSTPTPAPRRRQADRDPGPRTRRRRAARSRSLLRGTAHVVVRGEVFRDVADARASARAAPEHAFDVTPSTGRDSCFPGTRLRPRRGLVPGGCARAHPMPAARYVQDVLQHYFPGRR